MAAKELFLSFRIAFARYKFSKLVILPENLWHCLLKLTSVSGMLKIGTNIYPLRKLTTTCVALALYYEKNSGGGMARGWELVVGCLEPSNFDVESGAKSVTFLYLERGQNGWFWNPIGTTFFFWSPEQSVWPKTSRRFLQPLPLSSEGFHWGPVGSLDWRRFTEAGDHKQRKRKSFERKETTV